MNEAALLNAAPISTVRDHEGAGRLDPRTVVASDNTPRSDIEASPRESAGRIIRQ
jgi:hypothetical protein